VPASRDARRRAAGKTARPRQAAIRANRLSLRDANHAQFTQSPNAALRKIPHMDPAALSAFRWPFIR
jgi:hypothetical protein